MTNPGGPSTPTAGMSDATVNARPATREELYARIKSSSRDQVIVCRLIFFLHRHHSEATSDQREPQPARERVKSEE
mgnify:CR=1 FL=1